jgi:hypothetical protein
MGTIPTTTLMTSSNKANDGKTSSSSATTSVPSSTATEVKNTSYNGDEWYCMDPIDSALYDAVTKGPPSVIQSCVNAVMRKEHHSSTIHILDRWLCQPKAKWIGFTFVTACVDSQSRTHTDNDDRNHLRLTALTSLLEAGADPNRASPTGDTLIELLCRRRATLAEFELVARYGIQVYTPPRSVYDQDEEIPSLLHKMVAEPLPQALKHDAPIQPGTIKWLIKFGKPDNCYLWLLLLTWGS